MQQIIELLLTALSEEHEYLLTLKVPGNPPWSMLDPRLHLSQRDELQESESDKW